MSIRDIDICKKEMEKINDEFKKIHDIPDKIKLVNEDLIRQTQKINRINNQPVNINYDSDESDASDEKNELEYLSDVRKKEEQINSLNSLNSFNEFNQDDEYLSSSDKDKEKLNWNINNENNENNENDKNNEKKVKKEKREKENKENDNNELIIKQYDCELLELYNSNILTKFDDIWSDSRVDIIIDMITYLLNERVPNDYAACIETYMIPIDKEVVNIILNKL
jgi:hypothetical protein